MRLGAETKETSIFFSGEQNKQTNAEPSRRVNWSALKGFGVFRK